MDVGLISPVNVTGNMIDHAHACKEDMAQELMPGIGIRDIFVGLKCVFSDRIPIMKYEYAYRSGDILVLINGKREQTVIDEEFSMEGRNEYDLRILEELTVRRMEILRCGILINRDYPLIDCGEQKIKQMLSPKAYELLRKYNMDYFGNTISWNDENESNMSEISITWNQYESPQDLSEVWSPEEGDGLEFLHEISESREYPKHIIIKKRIGYMFMPGIYYFGGCTKEFPPASVCVWQSFREVRKCAVAGYQTYTGTLSPNDFHIMYLAIDNENIEILKKIQKTLGTRSLFVECGVERRTDGIAQDELDELLNDMNPERM